MDGARLGYAWEALFDVEGLTALEKSMEPWRAERSEMQQPVTQRIERDTFTIGECILHIQRRVLLYKRVLFFDLFPEDATRSEIVTTFLAMLELLKANRITITQEDIYAPIVIEEGKGGVLSDDADGTDLGG